MNPLQSRLAALRRRLRWVVLCRGVGSLAALVLAGVLLGMAFDWHFNLPSVVRALLLVGLLTGGGLVAWRFLVRPLVDKMDDLTLALRVEEQYPILNDALASTVQFLQTPEDDLAGSPTLRREAVQRALRLVQGCDFNALVDRRGVRWLAVAALLAIGASAFAFWQYPLAPTALARLLDPFGNHTWTRLTVEVDGRKVKEPVEVAKGGEFHIGGELQGYTGVFQSGAEFKTKVVVKVAIEGHPEIPVAPEVKVDPVTKEIMGIVFAKKISNDFTGQERTIRFQVRAYDSVSQWHEVRIVPPPRLTKLNGQESPQIDYLYPAYTDLPPRLHSPASAGHGTIDVWAGTVVTLRAAVDRPITRAWIEYLPKELVKEIKPDNAFRQPAMQLRVFSVVGAANALDAMARYVAGQAVWDAVPAVIAKDGKQLAVTFQPWVNGKYVLHFQDSKGLGNPYSEELIVKKDPLPIVNLVKPTRDKILLPDATLVMQVEATDDPFALRSVYLEIRRRKAQGRPSLGRPGYIYLYHHEATGRLLPRIFFGLALPVHGPTPVLRLRHNKLDLAYRLPLKVLRVEDGDVLIVQPFADDFNNVYPFNPPGSGDRVEVRIVGQKDLDRERDNRLIKVQEEMVDIKKLQDKVFEDVKNIQQKLDKLQKDKRKLEQDPKVDAKDRDKTLREQQEMIRRDLVKAEENQDKVKQDVGVDPDKGIRGQLQKLQELLDDNNQPPSNVRDRIRILTRDLKDLAKEQLPKIEQNLEKALKDLGAKSGKEPPPNKDTPLDKVQQQQQDARKALDKLLKFLNPWASVQQVKKQAEEILDKQQDLLKDTGKLEKKGNAATDEEIAKLVGQQQDLADMLDTLLNKLKDVGEAQAKKGHPEAAKRLREALEQAVKEGAVQERNKQAADRLKKELALAEKNGKKQEADRLRKELKEIEEDIPIKQAMVNAKEKLDNKFGDKRNPFPHQAEVEQDKAIKGLKKVLDALEEDRDKAVAQQRQRQAQQEEKIAELLKRQEDLHKKAQEKLKELDILEKKQKKLAADLNKKIGDPKEIKAAMDKIGQQMKGVQKELDNLAQEQRQLQKEAQQQAQDLAQEPHEAGQDLKKAAQEMERAVQMLEKREDPEKAQNQAIELLKEAKDEIQDAQEELIREQLAKIADKLKALKERQDAAALEMIRLQQDSIGKLKRWTQALYESLKGLGEDQKTISRETDGLRDKIKGAKVFERIMEKAVKNMDDAVDAITERHGLGRLLDLDELELANEATRQETTVKLQQEASRRLGRLIDALKNEPQRPPQPKKNGAKKNPKQGDQLGGPGDGIPDIAQLKALRDEQKEVNQRTRAFVERQIAIFVGGGGAITPAPLDPETLPMTDAQKTELAQIQAEQAALRELLELITNRAPAQKGENP